MFSITVLKSILPDCFLINIQMHRNLQGDDDFELVYVLCTVYFSFKPTSFAISVTHLFLPVHVRTVEHDY